MGAGRPGARIFWRGRIDAARAAGLVGRMRLANRRTGRRGRLGGPLLAAALLTGGGCVHVKTEPIRIEPIYIEITINHRVQKELDNLFADLDRASTTMAYRPLENSPSANEE